jgi:hypothetical protein
MNTPLLQRLREHLASISKEQFRKEWSEIEALKLQGPTMEEFIHLTSLHKIVLPIETISYTNSTAESEYITVSVSECNYASAA